VKPLRDGVAAGYDGRGRRGEFSVKHRHIGPVSKSRIALAQEDDGLNFDLVSFMTFLISILTAVDGLLQRKAEQPET
jgi:hypothetical protein